ncbi:LysR family transcriptional regulator [Sedimentitalea sp. XS_ASV28]|uniref:LysR family transcriptional regulator n=1 Tax=Sedimentitalea sp. XS_ASV28 TaxID=3241296 RepID=UPI0035162022
MSLVHLKTFLEVYRQGAFTRAAGTLGLTQPAVTQHIAALETVLERQLFQRVSRAVTPTDIAHDLARRIGDHLDLTEEILAEFRARSSRLAGTVHLCGPSDILSDLVAPHLHMLCAERISLQLHPTIGDEIRDRLLSGNADFGFSVTLPPDDRIAHTPLGREELMLVATPSLAARIESEDTLSHGLERTPFLSYSIERDLLRQWIEHHELDIGRAEESVTAPDLRALRGLVTAGLGWSVLPRYLVSEALEAGKIKEIEGPNGCLTIGYELFWTKASARTPRILRARDLILEGFAA